jgi:putative DNA primase/helicase
MPATGSEWVEAALTYAALGLRVLPVHGPAGGVCDCRRGASCQRPAKHPRINDWPTAASADPKVIRGWGDRWPDGNVGISTGRASGIVVLDVDRGSGGLEALDALEDEHGPLPDTLVVHTGGGGKHYYFLYPKHDVRTTVICPGVEIKSDGAFVVAPPSVHASGGEYQWEDEIGPGQGLMAEPPEWLATWRHPQLSANGHGPRQAGEMPAIPEGARNNTLASLAGTMQRRAMPPDAIRAALHATNAAQCVPLLSTGEVDGIVDSILRYAPDPAAVPGPTVDAHKSDLGNARRLVAAHGADVRFVPPWKKWLVWDGFRWRLDETGRVMRRAKKVATELFREACRTDDADARKDRVRFALRSEMEPRLKAMLELAKSEPGIPVLPMDLDTDLDLLNVANGTLDLRTGERLEPTRERLLTKLAPVRYDPDARCPLWESFLDRIFEGNTRLIDYIQRAAGYTLTGSTDEHVFFLLHGLGQNGKSTFLETLRYVVGDYSRQSDFTTFLESKSERVRNDLARLFGARFVTAVEAKRRCTLDEAVIKQLTGGDVVTARFLFGEYFEYQPAFKVWLAANHKPEIAGTDEGIWRRVQLVPFTVSIPKPEQDLGLKAKLREEAEGVLRWMVQGCLEWRRIGLGTPPEVTFATSAYRADSDVLAGFLADHCVLGPGLSVGATELYAVYVIWADQQRGEGKLSHRALSSALEERGILKDRGGGGGRVRYLGIALDGVEEADLKD